MKRSWWIGIVVGSLGLCTIVTVMGILYLRAVSAGYDGSAKIAAVVAAGAGVVGAVSTMAYLWATLGLLMETVRSNRQDRLDRLMPSTLVSLLSATYEVVGKSNPMLTVVDVDLAPDSEGKVGVSGGRARLRVDELLARGKCDLAIQLVGPGAASVDLVYGQAPGETLEIGALSEKVSVNRELNFEFSAGAAIQGRPESYRSIVLVSKALAAAVSETIEFRLLLEPWVIANARSTPPRGSTGIRFVEVSRKRAYHSAIPAT